MRGTCYRRLSAHEPASFAGISVAARFPRIFKECCGGNYERFIQETTVSEAVHHTVLTAESLDLFEKKLRPYAGYPLSEFFRKAPFLLAEFYFYHMLLELRRYECNGFDFFSAKKELAYCRRCDEFRRILTDLFLLRQEHYSIDAIAGRGCGGNILFDVLHFPFTDAGALMLCDDSAVVLGYIIEQTVPLRRIDIICNDSGTELFSDIYFASFVLSYKLAEQIVFHVKPYPFLELNATAADFYELVSALTSGGANTELAAFIAEKKIIVRTDDFWVLPCTFDEMPAPLHSYFAESSFVFVKGDANYRRLVRDIPWDYTENFAAKNMLDTIPVAALRIVMSEILNGADPVFKDFIRDIYTPCETVLRFGMIQCSVPRTPIPNVTEQKKSRFRIRT